MPKITDNTAFLIIFIAIILSYANSLSGAFLFDDHQLILDNAYIKSPKHIPLIFSSSFGRLDIAGKNYYRPLQELSYMGDYFLWKNCRIGYHLTSLWFHIAAAGVLFLLIKYIFKDKLIALFTALLFSVHPLYTSAVTYISGRADSMVIFFILAAFLILVNSLDQKDKQCSKGLIFSNGVFLLALFTKEIAATYIFIAIGYALYHWQKFPGFGENKKYIRAIAMALTALLLYVEFRLYALKTVLALPGAPENAPGIYARVLLGVKAFGVYLSLLFLPINLRIGRSLIAPKTIFEPGVLLLLFVFAIILYVIFKQCKGKGPIFFGLLWFLIWFIPVSNIIITLNAPVAENWALLPMLGSFLVIAKIITMGLKTRLSKLIMSCFIISLIFFAALTIKRNNQYKDPIVFYQQAVLYEPNNAQLFSNLGQEYNWQGNTKEAIKAYEHALIINPTHTNSLNNLASIYSAQGEQDQAIFLYKKALDLEPNNVLRLNNLGVAYIRKKDVKNALFYWKWSLQINPDQPQIAQYIKWNE